MLPSVLAETKDLLSVTCAPFAMNIANADMKTAMNENAAMMRVKRAANCLYENEKKS